MNPVTLEIETVIGTKSKVHKVLLTLAERMTRYYITIKTDSKKSKSVTEAIDQILVEYTGYLEKY